MSVGSGGWYVRARGRVLGPFNWSQLESMRERGQLSQAHEVSQDRRSWIKATELSGLYAPAVAGPSQPLTNANVEWPAYTLTDDAGGSPAPRRRPRPRPRRLPGSSPGENRITGR